MFVTDITNCYASMYTHTIAWALMGKEKAKEKKQDKGSLGTVTYEACNLDRLTAYPKEVSCLILLQK